MSSSPHPFTSLQVPAHLARVDVGKQRAGTLYKPGSSLEETREHLRRGWYGRGRQPAAGAVCAADAALQRRGAGIARARPGVDGR